MLLRHTYFLIAILTCLSLPCLADNRGLREGSIAPDWVMTDISGQHYSLYQELESGRQVAMVFWSTWCKFCKDMLPELSLFRRTLDGNTRLFAMNIWETGDPVAYFDTRNIDIPLFLRADDIAERYDVEVTPGLVFIGNDKKIRYIRRPEDSLNRVMRKLQLLVLEDKFPTPVSGG